MTKLHDLAQLGQSIWYDNIQRGILDSGEFAQLVEAGVLGVTSNPSIFEKAIAHSSDYDTAMARYVAAGYDAEQVYEALALEDIARAADMLRPVYDRTDGLDGYVSLEVDPRLADNTEQTIADARRFFATLNRPNIMIKVPATPEGMPAVEALIGEGINVNVTLIFSLAQYEAVTEAYIAGLEKLAASGGDVHKVASVASFFVSRLDSKVDQWLEDIGNTELQGKIAVANSKVVYARFEEIFSGPRWQALVEAGARVQRPLWASTSTKNPAYPDTLYVDTLIGPHTVNTVPPNTLDAILDHATAAVTVNTGVDDACAQLEAFAEAGLSLEQATQELLDEGVDKFAASFDSLLSSVAEKRAAMLDEMLAGLGDYRAPVEETLAAMTAGDIVPRLWAHDHTVWKPEPNEITNRLGWLHLPESMQSRLDEIASVVDGIRADGYTHVLLLGMGGSSLAPEVFARVFDAPEKGLALTVLDSTHPQDVQAMADAHDLSKTLFIVATKSGGTVETLSFFKTFYNRTAQALGADAAGAHFVAITDPGSKLEALAKQYNFRHTFLNDPEVGGRNSALSLFGLVPAALVGVDVAKLLWRGGAMADACREADAALNPGARLGVIMGTLAKAGRDKLTFVASPEITPFVDWAEQLIAESTGKDGVGILPVVREPLAAPDIYGDDRVFVCIRLGDDDRHAAALETLRGAGHPVVQITAADRYDLGRQFFLWEVATALSGHVLGINPFDQPNVEAAKVLAREAVAAYTASGALPEVDAQPPSADALSAFMESAQPGDYVVLQAYLPPTAATTEALQNLRLALREQYHLATASGYGPRFLHSTGQLHKGDGGNGLFIQLVGGDGSDLPIPDAAGEPDSALSFGVLIAAQAAGDLRALRNVSRRVIRFDLGADVVRGLGVLVG